MPKTTKTVKPVKKRTPKKPAAGAKPVTAAKTSKLAEAPLAATTAPEVIVTEEVVNELVLDEPSQDAAAATAVEAETVQESVAAAEPATAEPKPASVESQSVESREAQSELAAGRTRRVSAKYLVLVGILLLLVAGGLRWYTHTHPDSSALTAQNKSLVAEVAERVVVPPGETPTITTVVDKDKVSQTFLANAVNGDKVLLYFQAGKAIVYRPSTHQVVNIGPLQQSPVKIFLRSGIPSGQIPASIRSDFNLPAEYTIVSQDTSPQPHYTKTLVIDLTGNRPDIAARVAKTIGGQVASLPSGETKPDADILIIVGSETK